MVSYHSYSQFKHGIYHDIPQTRSKNFNSSEVWVRDLTISYQLPWIFGGVAVFPGETHHVALPWPCHGASEVPACAAARQAPLQGPSE